MTPMVLCLTPEEIDILQQALKAWKEAPTLELTVASLVDLAAKQKNGDLHENTHRSDMQELSNIAREQLGIRKVASVEVSRKLLAELRRQAWYQRMGRTPDGMEIAKPISEELPQVESSKTP